MNYSTIRLPSSVYQQVDSIKRYYTLAVASVPLSDEFEAARSPNRKFNVKENTFRRQ
jgi:hypothetical protein